VILVVGMENEVKVAVPFVHRRMLDDEVEDDDDDDEDNDDENENENDENVRKEQEVQ
jgi:hypothetical protein